MVTLNKIYTRTGDGGDTALGDGTRVSKDSTRVEAYGTVDELNSIIGIARLHVDDKLDQQLSRIQNDLFDIGADLCRPEGNDEKLDYTPLRATEAQVLWLENQIDVMNAPIPTLKSFILPGGSAASAHLHHCRTVSRRAERLTIKLSTSEEINTFVIKYLNRVSDWFFVAARQANNDGARDVLWVPGANR